MRTDNMEAVGASGNISPPRSCRANRTPSVKGVKALLELAAKERPEAAKGQPERFINALC